MIADIVLAATSNALAFLAESNRSMVAENE